MKTFKTLDQILKVAKENQVTAQELLNGRLYLNYVWQNVQLTPELKEFILQKISTMFGGRENVRNKIYSNLKDNTVQHWSLNRVVISKYGNDPAELEYIVGQDQDSEYKIDKKRTFHIKYL